jgi:hypothetical protein
MIVDGVERIDVQRVEALESGEFIVDVTESDENGEVRFTPEGPVTRRISADAVTIVWNHEAACQTCLYIRRMSAPGSAPGGQNRQG